MTTGVFHLEKLPHFRRRVVELNRVHDADNAMHDALLLDGPAWKEFAGRDGDAGIAERALAARRGVAAIHESFPAGAAAHEQAAYLVRAFNGVRPFDTANHETAWDFLGELFEHNNHGLLASEDEGGELGNEVYERLVRLHGAADGFPKQRLAERDEVFEYLVAWFHHRIG